MYETILKAMENDINEPDKMLCHLSRLRLALALEETGHPEKPKPQSQSGSEDNSNFMIWMKAELDRVLAGCEEDNSMQRAVNENILDVGRAFCRGGHSGFSASYTINALRRLLNWLPMTPLTGEDDEWGEIQNWGDGIMVQQNLRCSAVFRNNRDNETAHYINGKVFSDDGGKTWYSGSGSSIKIKFPFDVPVEPKYIRLNFFQVTWKKIYWWCNGQIFEFKRQRLRKSIIKNGGKSYEPKVVSEENQEENILSDNPRD